MDEHSVTRFTKPLGAIFHATDLQEDSQFGQFDMRGQEVSSRGNTRYKRVTVLQPADLLNTLKPLV